jgi:hypothetical protein
MRPIAFETFKIIHKKSPLFLQDLVTIKNSIYNSRYINTADIPRPRTTGKVRWKLFQVWGSKIMEYIVKWGQKYVLIWPV